MGQAITPYVMAGPLDRIRRSVEQVRDIITGKKRNHNIGSQQHQQLVALEIPELVTRDIPGGGSTELIEMITYCQPVKKASRVLLDYVFSSPDGIDQGLSIDEKVGPADDAAAVNPEIKRVGDELIKRIGMQALRLMAKRTLEHGDSFVEKIVSVGSGPAGLTISGIQVLPTFQMFRIEDDHGRLMRFEQRRSLYNAEDTIRFTPVQITHTRYDQEYLYGRSFFSTSQPDWHGLRVAVAGLGESAKAAFNPIMHIYPDDWDDTRKEQYEQIKNKEYEKGILTQIFTSTEVEVTRLAHLSGDISSQVGALMYYRRAIKDNCRLPTYLWTDEQTTGGARDIAGQPALAFNVLIQSLRQCLGEGIREIVDTELILQGFIAPESREYQLKWPSVHVRPQAQDEEADDEADDDSGSDDDSSGNADDDDSSDLRMVAGARR